MNPNEIILALLEEFKKLEHIDTSQWNRKLWGKAVLTPVCRIGKEQFNYSVYARSDFVDEQYKSDGEWLYDVTWCEYKGDYLKSVPLAAECEWDHLGDIKDDFEKLIQARASVRVFIFDSRHCRNGAEALAIKLCNWVGAFEGSQKGDTYLLVAYEEVKTPWNFRYFSILVDGPIQQPVLKRL